MPDRKQRRYIIIADGFLLDRHAKTAHGMLRYSQDDIVAIVDREHAGRDVFELLPALGRHAPVVADVKAALPFTPTCALVGVATAGGVLPPQLRAHVLAAVDAGLEIVSGLHQLLRDDPEFSARARVSGSSFWDVRLPPERIPLFSGAAYRVPQVVALAVGSDCA
ncbi:MAG: DUF1611 domain-containing protein, partial [Candidatus Eremiobacteraeota bacterium]|nr:DUF1611 domain-containing protein [Candidatus Eremiobacteraeota bacterium]